MAQMRVFLSHSSTDRDFADALAKALRDAGADVWYDESHLGTGQLLREISRQLAQRPVFVVVLSKAAFASEWVPRECEWAYNLYAAESNRIILPIVAEPIETSDWYEMLWLESFRRVSGPGNKPYHRDEAIRHALHLLALTPIGAVPAPTDPQPAENVYDLIERGRALATQERFEEAITIFERVTELAPSNSTGWSMLGDMYVEIQEDNNALRAYEQAAKLDPDNADIWDGQGIALLGLDRLNDALEAFEQAIIIDSEDETAWDGKGRVLQLLDKADEARVAFDMAKKLAKKRNIDWDGKIYFNPEL